ncbi:MAG: hypothetical protein NTX53_18015 [candidate division WOR-3 bacterium]|nr:hypothetical protein [candidate division WOR-3 bacterium]
MRTVIVLIAAMVLVAPAADQNADNRRPTSVGAKQIRVGPATDAVAIPRLLSYQGKLTDSLGVPVPDTTYPMTFRLYTQPTGGSSFWNEDTTVRTKGGLFTALLGSRNPITSVPEAGALYLAMKVGSAAEMTPRIRLVSAAYSFLTERASNSDALQGHDTSYFARTNHSHASVDSARVSGNSYQLEGNGLTALDTRYVNEGQSNSVSGQMIQDNAVTSLSIQDSTIQPSDLSFSPVARPLSPPVNSSELGDSCVSGTSIKTGAVTNPKLAANAVTSDKIQDGTIQVSDLGFTPTTRPLTPGVNSAEIGDTAVATAKLKDGAITNPKLAPNSVTSDKIQDGTIIRADVSSNFKAPLADTADYSRYAPGSIDSARVSANSHRLQGLDTTALDGRYVNEGQTAAVSGAMIQDNAVTSSKIQDSTVQQADLAFTPATRPLSPQVSTSEIADASVTNVKVASGIADTKISGSGTLIPNLNADELDGYHAANLPVPSHSHSLSLSGAVSGSGNVPGNIGTTLADNSVTSGKIQDGTIRVEDLVPGFRLPNSDSVCGIAASKTLAAGKLYPLNAHAGLDLVYGSSGSLAPDQVGELGLLVLAEAGAAEILKNLAWDYIVEVSNKQKAAAYMNGHTYGLVSFGGSDACAGLLGRMQRNNTGAGVAGVANNLQNWVYPVFGDGSGAGVCGAGYNCGVYGASAKGYGTSIGVLGETEQYQGEFAVMGWGDIACTGEKSAILKTHEGWRRVYCTEAPEVEFYDNGSAKLDGGEASVAFRDLFSEIISSQVPVRVMITPVGSWSAMYIVQADHKGFTVRSEAGDLNAQFNWVAIARRKGYEATPDDSHVNELMNNLRFDAGGEAPLSSFDKMKSSPSSGSAKEKE